jgi:translation elongation factor EF-1alpha
MAEKLIGKVEIYFSKAEVAAIRLEAPLKKGDKIHIKGNTTDFEQKINSMQIDRKDIEIAKKGDSVGIKVQDKVRPNDQVFKVE